jgi:hypothetical protein
MSQLQSGFGMHGAPRNPLVLGRCISGRATTPGTIVIDPQRNLLYLVACGDEFGWEDTSNGGTVVHWRTGQ